MQDKTINIKISVNTFDYNPKKAINISKVYF